MTNLTLNNPSQDLALNAAASRLPLRPPVSTRSQILPFEELTWEDFERLCYRIAGKSNAEYFSRYGRQGQSQQGIDLFVRLTNGKYEVWQAKRYASIIVADIKKIVAKFIKGTWSKKTEKLILAVQCSIQDTNVQDAIEQAARTLKKKGVVFTTYGKEQLSEILKGHAEVVDDFFGRQWVKAFLGEEVEKHLGTRLDGAQFNKVRSQLRTFYRNSFDLLDLRNSRSLSLNTNGEQPELLQRFTKSDVFVRRSISEIANPENSSNTLEPYNFTPVEKQWAEAGREYVHRIPLASWLGESLHSIVVGEPGCGKSNLLRAIALDILFETGIFPNALGWSTLLPLHISFSRLCRHSTKLGRPAGLKEIVGEILQPTVTADLELLLDNAIDTKQILLLLDGIDEWSDEQAARSSLQHIMAFVATHSIPTVITARQSGLDKICTVPKNWTLVELAPLSIRQQRQLAMFFFENSRTPARSNDLGPQTSSKSRLEQFFAELSHNRRLSALASNPLLLVALIVLAIEQQTLPRNRIQAIQSLLNLLIHFRPEQRATEAGEVQSRFEAIPSVEDRRATLGSLAFTKILKNGGGTLNIKDARQIIQDFLSDPAKLAYPGDQARKAANEILAANSEEVGLISHSGPNEVGFVHAIFEEFLAAEHILTWPFSEIAAFVSERSGDPLWREIILNLVSLLESNTKVEELISTIEQCRAKAMDLVLVSNYDILLADIAFNCQNKTAKTTERLMNNALAVVEQGDWLPLRRKILRTVLTAVEDAEQAASVDKTMETWAPARFLFRGELFRAFSSWRPSAELYKVLLSGLCAEERNAQHHAAATLARLYENELSVQADLEKLVKSQNLSVAAAALEALTLGWPRIAILGNLLDRAADSIDPTLRLIGISGRIAIGRANFTDRDKLIDLLPEFPPIDYYDRQTARDLLANQWPDDPVIVNLAVLTLKDNLYRRNKFGRESAWHYLLRCSASNSAVVNLISKELKNESPFSIMFPRLEVWDSLIPFVKHHAEIRSSVIRVIKSKFGKIHFHSLKNIISFIGGDELRDFLIEVSGIEPHLDDYWILRILLDGWGKSDPAVTKFLKEIPSWSNERKSHIAELLPEIASDQASCRASLFSIAAELGTKANFDKIARGFVALECSPTDSDVVDLLMKRCGNVPLLFDPEVSMLQHFSAHPRVRQFAIDSLINCRDSPAATIAFEYREDAEIQKLVIRMANSLPTILRSDAAAIAMSQAAGRPSCKRILENYDLEIDADLKISSSILYHKLLAESVIELKPEHMDKLNADVQAIGPDLNERRAAAFAGLLLLGQAMSVKAKRWHGSKALPISTGKSYGKENEALLALLVERWDELLKIFGKNLARRFGELGATEEHFWECLAPHLNASVSAKRDFLKYCKRTSARLGSRSLTQLANELPRSDVLLSHCLKSFDNTVLHYTPWEMERTRLDAAYILRDHFSGQDELIVKVRDFFLEERSSSTLVALCLISPENSFFNQIQIDPLNDIGNERGDWVTAVHLAARENGSDTFSKVLFAMLNRSSYGIWDFQSFSNRAIIEKLRFDDSSSGLVMEKLFGTPTANEIASLPQYIAAARGMDPSLKEHCTTMLAAETQEPMPRAAYDAISDSIRSVTQSLLEVIAPSILP